MSAFSPACLRDDLATALHGSEELWRSLDGAQMLLTGGTGFVGCWLLEAFCHAVDQWGIDARIDVASRNPAKLAEVAPHLASHRAVRTVRADVTTGMLPELPYTHVIHAAIQTNVALTEPSALEIFDSSVVGTRHVLDLCARQGVKRFLMVSSGAVYDRASAQADGARESDPLALVRPDRASGYAIGKVAAEYLTLAQSREYGFSAVIARLFAFVGPYLPLRSHYAVGNFIGDVLEGRDITIQSDGRAVRSYMYGSDMAHWIWTMLVQGANGEIFNVGGATPVSIAELAHQVAAALDPLASESVRVNVLGKPGNGPVDRYVPSVARAGHALGLKSTMPFDEGIRRTARWAAYESAHSQDAIGRSDNAVETNSSLST